jgi:hypothetical protein
VTCGHKQPAPLPLSHLIDHFNAVGDELAM